MIKKQNLNEELDRIKQMMNPKNINEKRHSYRDEDDFEEPTHLCNCCGGSGEGSGTDFYCTCCGGSGDAVLDLDDYDNDDDYVMWGRMDESKIEEQTSSNQYTFKSPGPTQTTSKIVASPITLGAGLFLNGVDKIDTGSQEYQNGIKRIQQVSNKTGGSLVVNVIGGASAVGSPSYDNEGLARRRAQNFINSVSDKFPNIKFTIATKVGVATTKNSPEANAEQFVKLNFNEPTLKSSTTPAIETTAAVMRNIKPLVQKVPKPKPDESKVTVCFDIPTSRLKYINWIVSTLGGVKK